MAYRCVQYKEQLVNLVLLSWLVISISFMTVSLYDVLEAQIALPTFERELIHMYRNVLFPKSFFGIAVGASFALVSFGYMDFYVPQEILGPFIFMHIVSCETTV